MSKYRQWQNYKFKTRAEKLDPQYAQKVQCFVRGDLSFSEESALVQRAMNDTQFRHALMQVSDIVESRPKSRVVLLLLSLLLVSFLVGAGYGYQIDSAEIAGILTFGIHDVLSLHH